MAKGSNDGTTIIIKRIKKADHSHHGGAWKVAYADFVTAMMAFFLLLWLLNVTTDVERKGIADYFSPASISKSESGAGGMMGGQSMTSPGAQLSDSSPPGVSKALPEPDESLEGGGRKDAGADQSTGLGKTDTDKNTQGNDKTTIAPLQKVAVKDVPPDKLDDKALEEAKKREEESFKKAEEALHEAIKNSPEMASLENNLLIDSTPEGLRIQIVDKDGYSLFTTGNANLVGRSRELVMMVGKVISRLPNKITVAGNTDSTPYRGLSRSNNWELSAGRAYSSMMALMMGGITEDRVTDIRGKADREPLIKNDTKNPQNRRISIILLRRYGNDAKSEEIKDAEKPDTAAMPEAKPALPAPADFSNKLAPSQSAAPLPTR